MVWDKTAVDGTTVSPCAGTVNVTGNWDAIERWWNADHYGPDNTLSGYHKPGIIGIANSGTYSTIAAISSPGTGALAWDNTCGVMRIYKSDGAWDRLTEDHYSRVKITAPSQSLPATAWTEIEFTTEVADSLGEWAVATNTLRVKAEGYYLIKLKVSFPVAGNYEKAAAIYKDGTVYSQFGGSGEELLTPEVVDIVYCAANALIEGYAYNGSSAVITMSSAILELTRLS